jgi:hypothetical protein
MGYETSDFRASPHGRRAPGPGGGPAFVRGFCPPLRRCQILLASARGERVPQIAHALGCDEQSARNAIHAFNTTGVAALQPGSAVPHTLPAAFDPPAAARLRALLHHSPRACGKETSLWTLDLAAEVSFAQGLTAARVTGETIGATLVRLGVAWRRATHWITSPDPE